MSIPAMMSSASVEWPTPPDLFAALDTEFAFTLDPCATRENAKCSTYYTATDDGLARPWAPHRVFCNPPYGAKATARWVEKGWNEAQRGAVVVLLIPSRTCTKWWHRYVQRADDLCFLRGRQRFVGASGAAPFPSAVVVFRGPRNVTAPPVIRNACAECGWPVWGHRTDAIYCSDAHRMRAYRRRRQNERGRRG